MAKKKAPSSSSSSSSLNDNQISKVAIVPNESFHSNSIDPESEYEEDTVSEWTMNVATKLVLISFGIVIGYLIASSRFSLPLTHKSMEQEYSKNIFEDIAPSEPLISKEASASMGETYLALRQLSEAKKYFNLSVSTPFNATDPEEVDLHLKSLVQLCNIYLKPEWNGPLSVVELFHSQTNSSLGSIVQNNELTCQYVNALLQLEQFDAVVDHLVDRTQPLDRCLLHALFEAYCNQSNFLEALTVAEISADKYSDQIDVHNELSVVWLRLGNPEKSLESSQTALSIRNDDFIALMLCGEAAELLGLQKRSIDCYRAALERIPLSFDDDRINSAVKVLASWYIDNGLFFMANDTLHLPRRKSKEIQNMIVSVTKMLTQIKLDAPIDDHILSASSNNSIDSEGNSAVVTETVSKFTEITIIPEVTHVILNEQNESTPEFKEMTIESLSIHSEVEISERQVANETESVAKSVSLDESSIGMPSPNIESFIASEEMFPEVLSNSSNKVPSHSLDIENFVNETYQPPVRIDDLEVENENQSLVVDILDVDESNNRTSPELAGFIRVQESDSSTLANFGESDRLPIEEPIKFETTSKVFDTDTPHSSSDTSSIETINDVIQIGEISLFDSIVTSETEESLKATENVVVIQSNLSNIVENVPLVDVGIFDEVGTDNDKDTPNPVSVDTLSTDESNFDKHLLVINKTEEVSQDVNIAIDEGLTLNTSIGLVDFAQNESSSVKNNQELTSVDYVAVTTHLGDTSFADPVAALDEADTRTALHSLNSNEKTLEAALDTEVPEIVDASISDKPSSALLNSTSSALPSTVTDSILAMNGTDSGYNKSTISIEVNASSTHLHNVTHVVKALSDKELNQIRTARPLMTMANAYISQGQYDMAIKQLVKALKKAPSFADAYYLRAKLYEAKGEVEKSTNDYLKIFSELDPTNRTVFSTLVSVAMQYVNTGKYVEAAPILTALIRIPVVDEESVYVFPQDDLLYATISTALAITHRKLQSYPAALDALDASSFVFSRTDVSKGLEGLHKQRLQLYGEIYEFTGKIELAETAMLEAAHNNLTSWSELGEFYLRCNHTLRAITSFERHLQVMNTTQSSSSDRRASRFMASSTSSFTAALATVHKQLGSAYYALSNATVGSGNDSTASAVKNTTEAAYEHFSEAMRLGLDDKEMRRFFAVHRQPLLRNQESDFLIAQEDGSLPTKPIDTDDQLSNHTTPDAVNPLQRSRPKHRWVVRHLVDLDDVSSPSSLPALNRSLSLVNVDSILSMTSAPPEVPPAILQSLSALQEDDEMLSAAIRSQKKSAGSTPKKAELKMGTNGMGLEGLLSGRGSKGFNQRQDEGGSAGGGLMTAFEQQLRQQELAQEREEAEATTVSNSDISSVLDALAGKVHVS